MRFFFFKQPRLFKIDATQNVRRKAYPEIKISFSWFHVHFRDLSLPQTCHQPKNVLFIFQQSAKIAPSLESLDSHDVFPKTTTLGKRKLFPFCFYYILQKTSIKLLLLCPFKKYICYHNPEHTYTHIIHLYLHMCVHMYVYIHTHKNETKYQRVIATFKRVINFMIFYYFYWHLPCGQLHLFHLVIALHQQLVKITFQGVGGRVGVNNSWRFVSPVMNYKVCYIQDLVFSQQKCSSRVSNQPYCRKQKVSHLSISPT